MLRPELLQRLKENKVCKPLNADVWSGWSDFNAKDEKANKDATKYLRDVIIPRFKFTYADRSQIGIIELHSEGINARYIGLLKDNCKKSTVTKCLLGQILGLTVKNLLR